MSLLLQKRNPPAPGIADAFKTYFEHIKKVDPQEATEHTLRPPLYYLLQTIVDAKSAKVDVIHEAKKAQSGYGAPDFKFKVGGSILGYLENKKSGEDLDRVIKSEQITKYKQLSGNLLITNYLEWIWLKDGSINQRETLCYENDIGNRKARLDPDKAEKVGELIAAFLSTPPKGIAKAKDLALELAVRCHDLRKFLIEELIRQEKEQQQGKLFGLFGVFKKDVFHELSLAGFADAFAQTLGYGLFLARLNSGNGAPVTLQNAKQHIPVNFELIRELVNFLDELEQPEYDRIKWLVEEILSIMNNLNLVEIHEDLAFTKRQGRLLAQTEEERLLFAKDPYVYFYEDFLKAYDAKMRKGRGVYYTPPPVVNFIVRAINGILKDTFGIKTGLADRKRVTVLDFATGTGTFLLEVLQQIFDDVPEGLRQDVIREHALKNLYGFEYLIAPYTIAHLKLSQFLHDQGYRMQPKERLQIYLTNTLEPIEPEPNFWVPALANEVKLAQDVKDKKILVITGNPPYSGHSLNKGKWITGLIESYRRDFPDLSKPGQGKWLQDDYVKFIRFAQHKMETVKEGIVGIITNHSFLDNPTFKGMRKSLMETFNQIYILDLHGSTKKKDRAPDGSKDENVFDIEQGVAISIFIKKAGLERKIFHSGMWGRREEKYRICMESAFDDVHWTQVTPDNRFYLFVPRDNELAQTYSEFQGIPEIFSPAGDSAPGIVTTQDEFAISFTKDEGIQKVGRLLGSKDENEARRFFTLCSQNQWNYERAKAQLADGKWKNEITELLYRPFDRRWTVFNSNVAVHRRERVMRHMLDSIENIGLNLCRQVKTGAVWQHVMVSNRVTESTYISNRTSEIGYLFPLYLYPHSPETKKPKFGFCEDADPFNGKDRIENFAPAFRAFISKKYDFYYEPEVIFGYIYAVLHSPSYRKKYAVFLKIDFPRVPFTDDKKLFEKVSKLGWALVQAHLLKDVPDILKVDVTKGNDAVEKPIYNASEQKLHFNKTQYFAPVPEDVWNFHIGGYLVLDKYLKSRKGRILTLDEKENVMNVVKVLRFTIDQMTAIDKIWQP